MSPIVSPKNNSDMITSRNTWEFKHNKLSTSDWGKWWRNTMALIFGFSLKIYGEIDRDWRVNQLIKIVFTKHKFAYRVTLCFPGVLNLHKHSIFFLRPIGPFIQYSLRPKEEWRTLDTSLVYLLAYPINQQILITIILLHLSSHLQHVKNTILFSQFLRLWPLCSDNTNFNDKCEEICQFKFSNNAATLTLQ